MQRQGGFAFLHQSANGGKMVNVHEKTSKRGDLRQAGQTLRPRD
jgi:hypothetical protein